MKLSEVADRNRDMITGKVLAEELLRDASLAHEKKWDVNGEKVVIGVEKV